VLEKYAYWRPSPLYRARGLEKALDTPAKIYYKHEGVSPAGSHKPNTAIPQAYYNKVAGTKKICKHKIKNEVLSRIKFFCPECKRTTERSNKQRDLKKVFKHALIKA